MKRAFTLGMAVLAIVVAIILTQNMTNPQGDVMEVGLGMVASQVGDVGTKL